MKLFHKNPIFWNSEFESDSFTVWNSEIISFETVKSKVIISLFETVRLSVSISRRNLYNSLKSIKENAFIE